MIHIGGVPFFRDVNLNIKMGKEVLVLLALVFTFSFVVASVDVHNYTVDGFYSPFENISGEINLTIVGEEYGELITSNDGDEISLGEFLDTSGNLFECSPPDCSNDYSSSSGVVDKSFVVPFPGDVYLGFVLNGENVVVDSLSFKMESDFDVSPQVPLEINFFEKEEWKFSEFSGEFLEKNWGCYDSTTGLPDVLIGEVFYCEMVYVPETGAMRVGVVVNGSDTLDLDMTVFPESGVGGSWFCNYNPNSEDGCIVSADMGEVFSTGNYQVCVSASENTEYRIYSENGGENCGFVYDYGPTSSSKDYAIYAQGAKYADASLLSSVVFGDEEIITAINDLIVERYEGDCSDDCILPLAISGVFQNARIYDVSLEFTKNLELDSSNKIYDLDVIPVSVDFSGVVDLMSLSFSVSKTMKYIVSLGTTELFSKFVDILPAPIISSVFPLNPPAGVPVVFYAGVNYSDNKSLTYKWKFGDNASETTDVNYIKHTYSDLKNYSLLLEVSAGGNLTSKKTFIINTISPEEAINSTLDLKRKALGDVTSKLTEFPSWYSVALGKLINVDFFEGELDRIDRLRDNAFVDADFIKIAEELYALDVPAMINVENLNSPYLINNIDDVDIGPVEIISGTTSGATSESYAKPILNWQNLNVDVNYVSDEFSLFSYSDNSDNIFRTYSFDVKMKDTRESYFVINRPFSELYFKESAGARKAGDATVIILPAESDSSFEFYYESGEPTTFFVSPKLSSIILEADIDTTCDYDLICEKELGENPSTCRSDCKPIFGAIVYGILSLVFVLILYTILQIWYKRHYENFLFKDRRQLYNILMYVTNARARGMKGNKIVSALKAQGWSSERINYIIKKSIGKRTGLYEIVPIEKLSAFFRNRKAMKIQKANLKNQNTRVVTGAQQQMGRNINKSRFQRRLR